MRYYLILLFSIVFMVSFLHGDDIETKNSNSKSDVDVKFIAPLFKYEKISDAEIMNILFSSRGETKKMAFEVFSRCLIPFAADYSRKVNILIESLKDANKENRILAAYSLRNDGVGETKRGNCNILGALKNVILNEEDEEAKMAMMVSLLSYSPCENARAELDAVFLDGRLSNEQLQSCIDLFVSTAIENSHHMEFANKVLGNFGDIIGGRRVGDLSGYIKLKIAIIDEKILDRKNIEGDEEANRNFESAILGINVLRNLIFSDLERLRKNQNETVCEIEKYIKAHCDPEFIKKTKLKPIHVEKIKNEFLDLQRQIAALETPSPAVLSSSTNV